MELPMIYKISPRPSFPKRGGKDPHDYAKTLKNKMIYTAAIIILFSTASPLYAEVKAMATVLPVYIFAKNVIGNGATLGLLMPPGTDLHEFALRPKDMKAINEADVIFSNGASLESFMEDGLKGRKVIDTSKGIKLIKKGGIPDPHIWLDPINAIAQVKNIRDEMIKIDPRKKELYEGNARAYIKRLVALDAKIRNALSGLKRRHLITYHEAFNYFAGRYGLTPHAIKGLGIEDAGPGNLKEVYDIVRREAVPAVFVEKGFPESSVERLKRDLGVRVCALDALETGTASADYYEKAMNENLSSIVECLGGK
jgi:zinc/manganese transport system substrate-binding protein